MCPYCQAPFVEPPTPQPPPDADLAPKPFMPGPSSLAPAHPAPKTVWWIVGGALALALLFGPIALGALNRSARSKSPKQPAALASRQSMLAYGAETSPAMGAARAGAAEPAQGMFEVREQKEQPPTIEIANGTQDSLRIQLRNEAGQVFTDWVAAQSTQKFTLVSGRFDAYVDAPGDSVLLPAKGTVEVKDFHHYEADFEAVPGFNSANFYIGD